MKAGFGRSDITPRLGVQLAGYGPYRNREAREIVAPLKARAAWLAHGRSRALLISLELCGLPRELDRRIREHVGRAVRLDPENVFLSVTHTHSAPAVGGMFGWGEADPLYVETLPARIVPSAREAKRNAVEVEWREAEVPAEGIAVNRETDAGFALEADFDARIKSSWRPSHPEHTDPTVRVLAACAGQKLVGLLHHFGCHPVVYGEKTNAVHGDYAGKACDLLEREHPGATAIFLPGALGDINPKLNHRSPKESRRALNAIGRQYAARIEFGLRRTTVVDSSALVCIRKQVRFSRLEFSRAHIERRVESLAKALASRGVTDFPHTRERGGLFTCGMEMARLEGLRSIAAQFRGARMPNPPVVLHVLQLGSVALVGCGLEIYSETGRQLMAAHPEMKIWPVSLVGGMGYAPPAHAPGAKGYAGEFIPLICGEVPFRQVESELRRAVNGLLRRLDA